MLGQQQKGFYLRGLRKLGIRDDEPPAKYHYLSNQIAGLSMEYIEETPKKVWIRYNPPWGTGMAMLAIPGSITRALTTAWHARNGALMGCPRLGWVSTKFSPEMEACLEGYFIEYDHDVMPGEEWRFDPVTRTPEFEASKAPRLDPQAWPEERLLKAMRDNARDYCKGTIEALFQIFGQQTTSFLLKQAMRGAFSSPTSSRRT